MAYLQTRNLSVGYTERPLIRDICLSVERGQILTLIGPNGAGKSTILKTLTRQLQKLGGVITLDGQDLHRLLPQSLARQLSVVLTGRIHPELMTCQEVVATGRYPYTGLMGRLTESDRRIVRDALEQVHGLELASRQFDTLSDGQRQRVLLARALCQQPQVMVLDEPTAYLDIRYKIELLNLLRQLARERGIAVVMSLHEIDLAAKVSDTLVCVKGETIERLGTPEEILTGDAVRALYDISRGSYDLLMGSVELEKPSGEAKIFVVGGAGYGIPCYRVLQKHGVAFSAGILMENDLEVEVAKALTQPQNLILSPAFEPISRESYQAAASLVSRSEGIIDAGTPVGSWNRCNQELLALAVAKKIPVFAGWRQWMYSGLKNISK